MENPSRLQVPLEVLLMRALPSLDVHAQAQPSHRTSIARPQPQSLPPQCLQPPVLCPTLSTSTTC
jgi:hypothetical protein